MSEDKFDDFYDEGNEIWKEDELTKYLEMWFWEMDTEKKIKIEVDLIETYYPGLDFLTDEELVRQKYYPSKHFFQYVIAFKRMLEENNRGEATPIPHGWSFFSAGGL